MRSCWKVWLGCVLVLCLGSESGAQAVDQRNVAVADAATQAALHDLARLAGVIFAGEVVAVHRREALNGATGVVEVAFAVDDAIRGVSGSTYILREWAGLWATGDEPFRVGQRYLMLLHTPGAAGFSSPVGGMDGAIPIRGDSEGLAPPTATRVAGVTVGASTGEDLRSLDLQTVDLRWIATRVVQPVVYRPASVARPTALPVSVRSGASLADSPSPRATPYRDVLSLLRGWERDDAAAR
jgi:hypothetical protein